MPDIGSSLMYDGQAGKLDFWYCRSADGGRRMRLPSVKKLGNCPRGDMAAAG